MIIRDLRREIDVACEAARGAGAIAMQYHGTAVEVEKKVGERD